MTDDEFTKAITGAAEFTGDEFALVPGSTIRDAFRLIDEMHRHLSVPYWKKHFGPDVAKWRALAEQTEAS